MCRSSLRRESTSNSHSIVRQCGNIDDDGQACEGLEDLPKIADPFLNLPTSEKLLLKGRRIGTGVREAL
jgi:hypothetical protein